jgi:guanyl-specific ribonuclease Sa
MDSRLETHNLTFGVVVIAITLAATMNVSLIPIPIANAINTSVDNSLASNRISFVASNSTSIPTISRAQLPPEALITFKNIEKGGPFPFPNHDGTTFLNREGILPSKPSGYYKEYTVPTLCTGTHGRGPQRIVSGQNGVMYYTPDHYNTFEQIIR